jgi:hypothetical protein
VAKRAHEEWCNESTVTGPLQSVPCRKMVGHSDLTLCCIFCAPLLFMNAQQVLPCAEVNVKPQALRELIA